MRVSGPSATLGTGNVTVQGTTVGSALAIQPGVVNGIADDATLSLTGGNAAGVADAGYAQLGSGVNEIVGALVLAGITQVNGRTYGSTSSGAMIMNNEFFAGTGIVTVGLLGDYNGDFKVDAADYVVWRKNDGTPEEFNIWRANFGRSVATGNGSSEESAVPEPGTLPILLITATVIPLRRRIMRQLSIV